MPFISTGTKRESSFSGIECHKPSVTPSVTPFHIPHLSPHSTYPICHPIPHTPSATPFHIPHLSPHSTYPICHPIPHYYAGLTQVQLIPPSQKNGPNKTGIESGDICRSLFLIDHHREDRGGGGGGGGYRVVLHINFREIIKLSSRICWKLRWNYRGRTKDITQGIHFFLTKNLRRRKK